MPVISPLIDTIQAIRIPILGLLPLKPFYYFSVLVPYSIIKKRKMKKTILATLVFLGSIGVSMAGVTHPRRHEVNSRLANQNARIDRKEAVRKREIWLPRIMVISQNKNRKHSISRKITRVSKLRIINK
jgi:hypothetical protein